MLFLGFGVAVGLVVAGPRAPLRTAWPWLAGALALALFVPHLLWQWAHGWPTLEFMQNARLHKNLRYSLAGLLAEQVLALHPATLPVWSVGLGFLLLHPAARRWRVLGVTYVAVLILLVRQGGKPYYLGPAYTWLFAAGATAIERAVRGRALRAIAIAGLAAAGVATAPLALPVLPIDRYPSYERALGLRGSSGERFAEGTLPTHFANMFGWDRLAALIADVYRSLPPEEQSRVGVLCENYMQAGAVDFYGRRLGLPPAMSGHNSYFLWQPVPPANDVLIVVGREEKDLREVFESVERHATFHDPHIQPIHDDRAIWVVRRPRAPLAPLWPRLKSFI